MNSKPAIPHYSVEALKERLMSKSKLQRGVVTWARVSDLMFGEDAIFARVRGTTGATITVVVDSAKAEETIVQAARTRSPVYLALVRREEHPFMGVEMARLLGSA